jgi:hypothetical protein
VEDIGSLRYWLADDRELALDAWDWLAALPANATILGSGPQPGRLHVAHVLSGGHSGRSHTFKRAATVLKHIRNSLAHGNIFTIEQEATPAFSLVSQLAR